MKIPMKAFFFAASLLWLLQTQMVLADSESPVQASAIAEFGFLGVPSHTIQFGKSGTKFDYVDEGGQDNLFFFSRYVLELAFDQRHMITFLYQPLDIQTVTLLNRDVIVDDERFRRDTPLDLRYGFDFYRFSYAYDLFGEYPQHELSLGVSLQLRNATINFTSADGTQRRSKRDLGPVPLLRARGRYGLDDKWWIGAEVDGFYAPIKYINGGDSDVEGAIVDLSVRIGHRVHSLLDLFLNLRYIGGGATGTSKEADDRADGYVSNWIHVVSLSVGMGFHPNRYENDGE